VSRIPPAETVLVVVDVQEAFRPYERFAATAERCGKLLAAARITSVPALVTEQYPKGLGHSAPELGLDGEPVLEKLCFSATRADGFELAGRPRALVCGLESHVCVENTVGDLLADGVLVHVVADACGSRRELDHVLAMERMRQAGATVETLESALFGLLDGAGSDDFKAIQRLVL
jgi:nicotinamidase-related amidase